MKKILAMLLRLVVLLGTTLFATIAVAGTATYYHNDLAGTPVVATNASGQVIWRESYRPYGERLNNEPASASNDIWFTSRRQDAETGLVYMGARYYDPVVGRFYSTDPAGFVEGNVHSFNRYAYANNNPLRYVDPTGELAETAWDIASFALSVAIFKADPTVANFAAATVDGLAIAVPFVPGGIGAIRSIGKADEIAGAVSKEITLSKSIHGEAATHAEDAIRAGRPDVLTIDRGGAAANRQASTGTLERVEGKHLDEYPPAMFKEGGAGASVRPIAPRDNMSAGACIGNACRGLSDGSRVKINVVD